MTTAEQTGTQAEAGEATHGVNLTDAAAAKAKALLDQEGRDDMHLRIAVQPGGCAGLRYQLFFDERTLDGDLFRDFDGLPGSHRPCYYLARKGINIDLQMGKMKERGEKLGERIRA